MKLLLVLVLCLLCPLDLRANSTPENSRILDYFKANDHSYVLFPMKQIGKVVKGKTFDVFRSKERSGVDTQVKTGTIKVVSTSGENALAMILNKDPSDQLSRLIRYPQIMIGDIVSEPGLTIEKRVELLPTLSFRFEELFVDPKSNPASFEISERGRERLREVYRKLSKARVPGIVIEGHTDPKGKSEVNQIESYQRALVVRHVMADTFKFDEKRMLAIGYGEAELADQSLTSGSAEVNRRIVIKPLSHEGSLFVAQ